MPNKRSVEKKQKKLKREKAKARAKKFHSEIRKSSSTAIVAAFSFLMALAWRDVISGYVSKITVLSPLDGDLISALIITIIAVIGIAATTKYLAVKEEQEQKK